MSEATITPARERRDARRFGDRIEHAVAKIDLALEGYSPRERVVASALYSRLIDQAAEDRLSRSA